MSSDVSHQLNNTYAQQKTAVKTLTTQQVLLLQVSFMSRVVVFMWHNDWKNLVKMQLAYNV